ncbi:MAG: transaldolase [Candidatus Omnitrophota bacterium]
MPKTKLEELADFGQSIWLDNISQSLLKSAKLDELIRRGVRGLTSNPSIFDKAISFSSDYDKKISELKTSNFSVFKIYDNLSIQDVRQAADLFTDIYKRSGGWDGFVSLEIDPRLAKDVKKSIAEARRLFTAVNRPNLMIKVPATDEGFIVIEQLLSEGINVNATLIFSKSQYERAAEAFLKGMTDLAHNKPELVRSTHSVASVFVSRLDTSVDENLNELIKKETDIKKQAKLKSLLGKAAVSNSHLIFAKHLEIFSNDVFKKLKEKGVTLQRIVWASTSTKNPAYQDIKYVTELISRSTINTLPENTIEAFIDHGIVNEALTSDTTNSLAVITELKEFNIDIDQICKRLLSDGIAAFQKSFESILNSIETKAKELLVKT